MLLFLVDYLHMLGWKIPAVFSYLSTRMILATITTIVLTIFAGPFFIKKLYVLKIGQSIRGADVAPQLAKLHEKKNQTPTMGGILVLFSMVVSMLLWMDLTKVFTWILCATSLWLGFVGGLDDYLKLKKKNAKALSAKKNFLMDFVFASLLGGYLLYPGGNVTEQSVLHPPIANEYVKGDGEIKSLSVSEYVSRVYVPFFKEPLLILNGILAFILIVFVVIGSSNAVNLTDGLDGLASGCMVMVAFVFGLVAFLSDHAEMARYLNILYIEGSGEIGIYLFALAGACLGFLWYNSYPAQVFLGDTGSIALGGIIGVSSVLLSREVLLAIVGGVFVAETLSVILQVLSYRYRNKKRIFLCSPLHHHFEYKGWPENKVVVRFWIVGLLLAFIGIASLKFQ